MYLIISTLITSSISSSLLREQTLSSHNKRIYLSCLSVKCKNDNNDPQRVYKYVWTNKGVTFLRKDEEGARAIRVDSIDKAIELGITILDD